jgi:ribosomal-protein-alanine N-acetyltransferase
MTGTTLHIPELRTERFLLRAAKPSDFDAYAEFRASDRVRMMGGPNDRDEAFADLCYGVGQWQIRGYGLWIIADRATDAPLGVTGFYYPEYWAAPEISWAVFEAAEGKGVAFEAASAARDYAFDALGWKRVISAIIPGNTRSIALAERLGATRDGTYLHPKIGEMLIYSHRGGVNR